MYERVHIVLLLDTLISQITCDSRGSRMDIVKNSPVPNVCLDLHEL